MSAAPRRTARGARFAIGLSAALADRLDVGASVAVAGVCLTVVARRVGSSPEVELDLADETLLRSRLGSLNEGDEVNLEPPLRVGDPLGGHWVQGHVDGTVELLAREDRGDQSVFTIALPHAHRPYVVEKGSVALDGVSLTVASIEADRFRVALIPHTLQATTLGAARAGDKLHLEVDLLAKYVASLLGSRAATTGDESS